MSRTMPIRDIFKGGFKKVINKIFRRAIKQLPTQSENYNNTSTLNTGDTLSYSDSLQSGFPANIRPSDEITKAKFSTFSSKALYNPKTNRYIDGITKRFISRETFINKLAEHRKQTAFEQSKLTRPNLTDRERLEILDKFVTASERLKQGREQDLRDDIIDGLSDEYEQFKDELGIESP